MIHIESAVQIYVPTKFCRHVWSQLLRHNEHILVPQWHQISFAVIAFKDYVLVNRQRIAGIIFSCFDTKLFEFLNSHHLQGSFGMSKPLWVASYTYTIVHFKALNMVQVMPVLIFHNLHHCSRQRNGVNT